MLFNGAEASRISASLNPALAGGQWAWQAHPYLLGSFLILLCPGRIGRIGGAGGVDRNPRNVTELQRRLRTRDGHCFRFLTFTEIYFSYHTIHPLAVYNLMVSGVFTGICNHQCSPFWSIFIISEEKLVLFFSSLSHPTPPPTNLPSASTDLPVLGVSRRRDHSIHNPLCLTSLTGHNAFKVHTRCIRISALFIAE